MHNAQFSLRCASSMVHRASFMIGFGELRKKSVTWGMEIGDVEKIYARDWLLYGMFENAALRENLILRGASALASAYFENYPRVADIDFARGEEPDDATREREMTNAVDAAARAAGLHFRLHSFKSSEARVEFTGPLGRRSAAQPLIITRFVSATPRTEISERALVHPFSDACNVQVRAVSLNELAAEHIVRYSQKPRARDVFDLWFILTHGENQLDTAETRTLTFAIAQSKQVIPRAELDAAYAPLLERAWENALKTVRPHPPFPQARAEIERWSRSWI